MRSAIGAAVLFACAAHADEQPAAPAAKPLDLRLGDIRRYVPPEMLEEPLADEQDEDDSRNVVVKGRRTPAEPPPEKRPVPQGIAAPFWAIRHPLKAWRVLVPDPNARASERPDPMPPPPKRY
jgi:hypothetical protein